MDKEEAKESEILVISDRDWLTRSEYVDLNVGKLFPKSQLQGEMSLRRKLHNTSSLLTNMFVYLVSPCLFK